MEVLRINGSIPTVSFSDLVPGGLYTIEYSDILSDVVVSASATANGSGDVSFVLDEKYASTRNGKNCKVYY